MQFNKTLLATTLLSIFTLSGCNGGGSDSSTSTPKTTINSLPNLQMCLDANNNGQCDAKEPSTITNKDGIGRLVITAQDKDKTILVKTDEQTLSAPATSTVVTPLTTLVVNEMKANKGMTVEDAQAKIKEKLADFTTKNPQIDIFGDPTQSPVLDKIANALKDTSANYNNVDLAKLASNAMNASQEEVPVINQTGKIDLQEQPQISQDAKEIKPQTLNIENQIQPIDLTTLFTLNGDSSALQYNVEGILPQGLTKKDNTIEGAITLAGTFSIKVMADNNGALSQPVTLTFKVTAPNTVPTVIEAGQKELQELTNQRNLTQGEFIGYDVTYPVSSLFSDAENDPLTVTAKFKATGTDTSNGITITQNGDELILSGTPIEKDEMTLTLLANDGVNAQSAEAIITIKVAEGIKPAGNQTQVILGQHTDINVLFIDNNGNDILSETSIDNGVITYTLDKSISGTYTIYGQNDAESQDDNFHAYKVTVKIENGVIQGPINFSHAQEVHATPIVLGQNTNIDTIFIGGENNPEKKFTDDISIIDNGIEYSNIQDLNNKKLNGTYTAYGWSEQDFKQYPFMGYTTPVTIKNGVIQGVINFTHSKGEMITD